MFEAGAAVREALFGNAREARQAAARALDLSHARDVEYGAAFALALSGDVAGSRRLANDLGQRFPEDTFVKFTYLPVLNALAALDHSGYANAIELLEASIPYERGVPGSWFGFFGNFYPTYVRGMAYLSARRGREASKEFQKILDAATIVWSDPVGAVARVQLGRALAATGDAAKAKNVYQDFLKLWKDADLGVPILRQAREEYIKLQ